METKQTNSDSISDVIKKRQRQTTVRAGYRNLILRVAVLAVAGWLLFTQVFLLARTNGNDMFPAIKDGDLLIAFRLQQSFIKDDVVVFTQDDTKRVGRLVADEGDTVSMDDSGTLLVNGTVQAGEIVYPTYAKETLSYPYQVPEGHVFLLGDHRPQATDSRDFGAVPKDTVEGKVITLFRRRGL